jgi:1-acyl-sn-glycerol-3-phosphate acyltransferase
MARVGGTIFIDRKRRLNSRQYIEDIAEMLKNKVNVLVFPEGTSTNGEKILPFQSIFFEAPLIYNSNILPLTICYTKINDDCVSVYNRDTVFWYGQIKFTKHLLRALKLKNIESKVVIHSRITAISSEKISFNRKQLSESLRQVILKALPAIRR